jgi:hypothetical protein
MGLLTSVCVDRKKWGREKIRKLMNDFGLQFCPNSYINDTC